MGVTIKYNDKIIVDSQDGTFTLKCVDKIMSTNIIAEFSGQGSVLYGENEISVDAGKVATLLCEGKVMSYDIIVKTQAAPTDEGNFLYELSLDENYYICAGVDNSKVEGDLYDIVISDTYNNKPIKEIKASAFKGNSSICEITIGNEVLWIGQHAFDSCSSLKKVQLGSRVESIGNYAFSQCQNLEVINIPQTLTAIKDRAFQQCINLRDVHITDIEVWCNISYDNDLTQPLRFAENLYLNGELVTNLVVPNGVTTIPKYAFSCSNITSVTIPDSVTSIDSFAFAGCQFSEVAIGQNVEEIGSFTFNQCNKLETIKIPKKVTTIGAAAFQNCGKLKTVYYAGSEQEWNNISISQTGNTYLTKATLVYNASW